MNTILTILILAAPALIILAAIYDVFTMTIPNRISIALIAPLRRGCALRGDGLVDGADLIWAPARWSSPSASGFCSQWMGRRRRCEARSGNFGVDRFSSLMLDYFLIAAIERAAPSPLAILILRRVPPANQ